MTEDPPRNPPVDPAPAARPAVTVTIALGTGRDSRQVALQVPDGPSRLVDLVRAAGTLADAATDVAVGRARAAGKEVSCRPGCAACCRHVVGVSVPEASALAALVDALPGERRAAIRARFADAVGRLERAGLLDPGAPRGERSLVARRLGSPDEVRRDLVGRYLAARVDCPFLDGEACVVYEDRPMVCRQHVVTTPAERCWRPHEEEVDRLEPPFQVGPALGRAAGRLLGIEPHLLPLVLVLEWAESSRGRQEPLEDGRKLFDRLMSELAASRGAPRGP